MVEIVAVRSSNPFTCPFVCVCVHSDLLVPLNGNDGSTGAAPPGGGRRGSVAGASDFQSPMAPRVRRMTFGSDDLGEKNAKMNIDMGNHRKGFLKQARFARKSVVHPPTTGDSFHGHARV